MVRLDSRYSLEVHKKKRQEKMGILKSNLYDQITFDELYSSWKIFNQSGKGNSKNKNRNTKINPWSFLAVRGLTFSIAKKTPSF